MKYAIKTHITYSQLLPVGAVVAAEITTRQTERRTLDDISYMAAL